MRRWAWQVVLAFLAAVLSLYVVYLVTQFYSYKSGVYEPKDFERQHLFEQTGRSVIEQEDQR